MANKRGEPRYVEGRVVIPRQDVAALFGLRSTSLGDDSRIRPAGVTGGGYYLEDVVQWAILRDRSTRPRDAGDSTVAEAKLRKAVADADKAEIEVEEKRGSLVPLEEIYKDLGRAISAAQSRLLQIPPALAPHLEGLDVPEIQRELTEALTDAMKEASTWEYQKNAGEED